VETGRNSSINTRNRELRDGDANSADGKIRDAYLVIVSLWGQPLFDVLLDRANNLDAGLPPDRPQAIDSQVWKLY